jgi:hypothetical protein
MIACHSHKLAKAVVEVAEPYRRNGEILKSRRISTTQISETLASENRRYLVKKLHNQTNTQNFHLTHSNNGTRLRTVTKSAMDTDLVLKLEWSWGGSKIVHASSTDTLSHVLMSNGFAAMEGSVICVAHRGRLLQEDFTLHFSQVKTGDRLICTMKKLPTKEKSRAFLATLSRSRRVVCQMVPVVDPSESSRRAEQARIADLSFSTWEAMNDLPALLTDLFRQESEQNQERKSTSEIPPTNLTEARQICEDPLPYHFQAISFAANGTRKGGPGWSSGFVKDIPDQSKRGDFFEDLKK